MSLFLPKRWQHFTAMVLIGDGIMALIHPQRAAHAWEAGPKPWQNLMHELHQRPTLTRLIGAAQVIGGVTWALSQEQEDT